MPDKDGKANAPATAYDPAEEGDEGGKEQSPAPPPPPAPADPVGDARRKLEQAKNALSDAEAKAKRDGEIEKAIAQYRGEQLRLEADEEAAKAQLREGLEELKPTDPEKAWVKQVRDNLEAEKQALEDSVATQSGELKQKRVDLDRLKTDLATVGGELELLKALGKAVQLKHRAADTLRKEAFDAIDRQKRQLAYYLLEYQLRTTISGEPIPIEMAAFVDAIKLASDKVGALNAAQRDLEADIGEREKKLADDEKRLADLRKSFEATIRERLGARA